MNTNFKALPLCDQENIASRLKYPSLQSMIDHEAELKAYSKNEDLFIPIGASVLVAIRSSQIHQRYWGQTGTVKAKRVRIYQARTFDCVTGAVGELKSVTVPVHFPEIIYYITFPEQDLSPINLPSELVREAEIKLEKSA